MSSRRIASLAGLAIGVFGNTGYAEEHPQTIELESVNVTSDYQYETATSPVQGYRATRSATATKTDTAIQDIPQSISVVPASVLKDLGSNSVERALEFAGGVSKQNNFGGLTLYEYSIRGFTTSEFYKDGFSANRGYPATPDAANIERIEVLKGPAASLYGRGDPGGTVNIVTKNPSVKHSAPCKPVRVAGIAIAPHWMSTHRWMRKAGCCLVSIWPSKTTTAFVTMSKASGSSSPPHSVGS